jgi:hypothetical protein
MLQALEVTEEISNRLGSGMHRCLDTRVISFMGLKMSWSDTSGGILHDLLA